MAGLQYHSDEQRWLLEPETPARRGSVLSLLALGVVATAMLAGVAWWAQADSSGADLQTVVTRPETSTSSTAVSTTTTVIRPTTSAVAAPATVSADGGMLPAQSGGRDGASDELAAPTRSDTSTSSTTASSTSTTAAPTTTAVPTTQAANDCFELVMRDDFDGTELQSHWQPYSAGGSHSVHDDKRPEAITVADGRLLITAQADANGKSFGGGMRHAHSQTYGRYAFRVRIDRDATNSTSGVILTWPESGNQPRDGESNIWETLHSPGGRSPYYSFIHEMNDDRADGVAQTRFVHNADASQWQTMVMEWTPSSITVERLGDSVQEIVEDSTGNLVPDVAHHLTVQLDLFKDGLAGAEPVHMEVDWVEVYRYCG